ncbi:MAG: HD-GYP domain-containing protein [Clostridia bacterium]|nr:HD-GYP domain-containing protein [Clostridia bacterium]
MRKISVSVHACEPGMEIAETIFNHYGAIIISENTILDEHLIYKLENLGITSIRVYEQEKKVIQSNTSEIFKIQYKENMEVIKDVLHDISTGKSIDLMKVDTVTNVIFDRINENRDIVRCITQIRSADEYTYAHCVNVSLLCMLIGKWLKYEPSKIKLLVQAGLLHDIGKSKVPPEILNKPGGLSKEEFEEIKKHPVLGYRIIESVPEIGKEVCMAVLMHHEKEDGSGYPVGLKGAHITDLAKIVTVADIYDAMTSKRVYKEKESPFEVWGQFQNNVFGQLSPLVVNAFLSNIAAYYIGDFVKLNTGTIGEIIYINPRDITKPILRVNDEYIDLSVTKEVKILEII